jgi:hypothetical protein
VSDICVGCKIVVSYLCKSPPFSSNSFPLPSFLSRSPVDEDSVAFLRQGCLPVSSFHLLSRCQCQAQDIFDGAPSSSSNAFAATSQRTFHGRQIMISVQVSCTACSATTSGRAELLPAQMAIRVDSIDMQLARSGIRPQQQLNLDPDLCFLCALSAFGRSRCPPWTQGHSIGTPIAAGARHDHPGGTFAVLETCLGGLSSVSVCLLRHRHRGRRGRGRRSPN